MNDRTLKSAFAVSTLLCVALASTLGYMLWNRWTPAASPAGAGPVVARGPEASSQTSARSNNANSEEPALSPASALASANAGNRGNDGHRGNERCKR